MNEEIITKEDLDEGWDVEFFKPEEIVGISALSEVDATLCESAIIGKSGTCWFALWTERHPELGTYEEYFPHRVDEDGFKHADRTQERLEEWHRLEEHLPPNAMPPAAKKN